MSISKILISQPRPATERSPYFTLEEKYGIQITFHQLIKVVPLSSAEYRNQKLPNISEHTAFVMTSKHAIDNFFSLCKELLITVNPAWKYYCVSEDIANYLQHYIEVRKRKIYISTDNTFEGLKHSMRRHNKEHYFVPMGEGYSNAIPEYLTKSRFNSTIAVMYRTVTNPFPADEPFDFDMIALFTPAGVAAIKELYPNYEQGDTKFICFGPRTATAIEEAGFRLDMQAPTPEAPNVPTAIECFLK